MTLAASVGIVVIGRNEGARLVGCLRSVEASGCPIIYVDSGSCDKSVERALEVGCDVVELDPALPFSAARARNEGFERLREGNSETDFVQFLDGDCSLAAGWISEGSKALQRDLQTSVVIGHLQERSPEATLYNRLCALEWRSPAGPIVNFGALGGIMLVRASVFEAVGGFNAQVIAGEDSEFGVRVGAAGHKITKLDTLMATHDADIQRFGQWWRRAVRSGHAIGQRSYLNGNGAARDCMRERRSVVMWGLVLPVGALMSAAAIHGYALIVLAAAYATLGWRVFRYRKGRGDSAADARLYAGFNVVGKLAEGVGLLKFFWNRALGRFRIIEYK